MADSITQPACEYMATLPEDLLFRVDALLSECAVFQSQLAGKPRPKNFAASDCFTNIHSRARGWV